MIRPGIPAPNLAPRMGRQPLREQAGVAYRRLETRSLLNRCDSPRVPFEWTVNPYRGCAMGCRYCYATYTHEFMGIARPEEFHTAVYVKVGDAGDTLHRLRRILRRGERIALGTATDPYQPEEARARVTRRFLELAAELRGVQLGVTTKGALVLRDLDLLQRLHRRSSLTLQVSLISTDADLLRRLEPWAPPPEARIEVMRRLAEAGLRVSLGLAPILPGLTDDEPGLDALLGRVRAAGVTHLFANLLFLRSPTKEKYLRWLAAEFPQYLEAYRRAYADGVYLRGGYRKRLEALVDRLRAHHGFEPRRPHPGHEVQLELWS